MQREQQIINKLKSYVNYDTFEEALVQLATDILDPNYQSKQFTFSTMFFHQDNYSLYLYLLFKIKQKIYDNLFGVYQLKHILYNMINEKVIKEYLQVIDNFNKSDVSIQQQLFVQPISPLYQQQFQSLYTQTFSIIGTSKQQIISQLSAIKNIINTADQQQYQLPILTIKYNSQIQNIYDVFRDESDKLNKKQFQIDYKPFIHDKQSYNELMRYYDNISDLFNDITKTFQSYLFNRLSFIINNNKQFTQLQQQQLQQYVQLSNLLSNQQLESIIQQLDQVTQDKINQQPDVTRKIQIITEAIQSLNNYKTQYNELLIQFNKKQLSIDDLNSQIDTLQQSLTNQNNSLTKQLKQSDTKQQELQQQLNIINQQLSQLKNEKDQLIKQQQQLTNQNKQLSNEKQQLLEQQQQQVIMQQQLSNDNKQQMIMQQQLTNDNEQLNNEKQQLLKQQEQQVIITQQLTNENKSLTNQNKSLINENKQLLKQQEQQVIMQQQLTNDNKQLLKQQEQQVNITQQLSNDNKSLLKQQQQLTNQNKQLSDQNKQLLEQVNMQQQLIDEKNQLLKQLEQQVTAQQQQEQKIKELLEENKSLKQQIEDLKQQMIEQYKKQTYNGVDSLQQELQRINDSIAQLQNKYYNKIIEMIKKSDHKQVNGLINKFKQEVDKILGGERFTNQQSDNIVLMYKESINKYIQNQVQQLLNDLEKQDKDITRFKQYQQQLENILSKFDVKKMSYEQVKDLQQIEYKSIFSQLPKEQQQYLQQLQDNIVSYVSNIEEFKKLLIGNDDNINMIPILQDIRGDLTDSNKLYVYTNKDRVIGQDKNMVHIDDFINQIDNYEYEYGKGFKLDNDFNKRLVVLSIYLMQYLQKVFFEIEESIKLLQSVEYISDKSVKEYGQILRMNLITIINLMQVQEYYLIQEDGIIKMPVYQNNNFDNIGQLKNDQSKLKLISIPYSNKQYEKNIINKIQQNKSYIDSTNAVMQIVRYLQSMQQQNSKPLQSSDVQKYVDSYLSKLLEGKLYNNKQFSIVFNRQPKDQYAILTDKSISSNLQQLINKHQIKDDKGVTTQIDNILKSLMLPREAMQQSINNGDIVISSV